MSKDRKIDDSELAEVTGGTQSLSDLQQGGDSGGASGGSTKLPGSGGGSPDLEEDNPGGGISGMEQSE